MAMSKQKEVLTNTGLFEVKEAEGLMMLAVPKPQS
jgi:hypothetical protein